MTSAHILAKAVKPNLRRFRQMFFLVPKSPHPEPHLVQGAIFFLIFDTESKNHILDHSLTPFSTFELLLFNLKTSYQMQKNLK